MWLQNQSNILKHLLSLICWGTVSKRKAVVAANYHAARLKQYQNNRAYLWRPAVLIDCVKLQPTQDYVLYSLKAFCCSPLTILVSTLCLNALMLLDAIWCNWMLKSHKKCLSSIFKIHLKIKKIMFPKFWEFWFQG